MSKINFIQIGANIGNTSQDVIWKIVRKKKWNGIFIEPVPLSFEALKENYKDLTDSYFENVAILNHNATVSIFTTRSDKNDRQQASLKKTHWASDVEIRVPCMRLDDLVEKYGLTGVEFELLQCDAEGVDDVILLDTDFTKVLPEKIRFENVHIRGPKLQKVMQHLKSFGYVKVPDEYSDNVKSTEIGFDTMVQKVKTDGK